MMLKLIPLRTGKYYEMVMIQTKGEAGGTYYPAAIVHIDTFWEGKDFDNVVNEALGDGKIVEINVPLIPVSITEVRM